MKKLSKILILVALIISLNPYLILFLGIPIYALGVLLFWFTRENNRKKILWTLTPIFIWYPLMTGFYSILGIIGTKTAQKRDYIIDKNQRGFITIIESKCGQNPILKDGRLQFNIPPNGIYLFNEELESGYINENYYIKELNGQLRKVEAKYFRTKKIQIDSSKTEKIIAVTGGSYGIYGDNKANFIQLYIATNKKQNEKEMNQIGFKHRLTIDSIRKDCKTKH
jgi:hypothetical protein